MTFSLVNCFLSAPPKIKRSAITKTLQIINYNNYNDINNYHHNRNKRIIVSSPSLSKLFSSISSSSTKSTIASNTDDDNNNDKLDIKKKAKKKGKDKRREFIGLAKNVDRGQYKNVYNPGRYNSSNGIKNGFENKSGLPNTNKLYTVLGIESSCDDTGVAIVRSDGVILGESLKSQHDVHSKHGGVVPGLARDEHVRNIDIVLDEALTNANMTLDEIDGIGVTVGPGLEICLRVGSEKAKELAIKHNKPFVGIHHLEAHILITRMITHQNKQKLEFPFLALLVSGGHCQILYCHGIGKYNVIGGTIDDSIGEAFDKVARLLNLNVSKGGGPAIESLAKDGNPTSIILPKPLQNRKNGCDFSYAGLKTSVRLAATKICQEKDLECIDDLEYEDKANIASSFQNIAISHIEQKLLNAISIIKDQQQQQDDNNSSSINTLVVVGGVASNMELRARLDALCKDVNWNMIVPPPKLCTDQGSMAAWAAIERFNVGSSDDPYAQDVFPRYPFVKF